MPQPQTTTTLAVIEQQRARLRAALDAAPLIAILNGIDAGEAEALAPLCRDEGLLLTAVPMDQPGAVAAIGTLAAAAAEGQTDTAMTGGAMVRHRPEVDRVAGAGGALVLMPIVDPPLITRAKTQGRIVLVSVMTPTEAYQAADAGADGLLLFPAAALQPAIVPHLLSILPKPMPVLPIGGIGADAMGPWRDAGAAGFVVGRSVWRSGQPLAETAQRLRMVMNAARYA